MPENFLYNLIYALISGFTEFLGVDGYGHRRLMELLTGQTQSDAILSFVIHIGALAAVICGCWSKIRRILRERRYSEHSRRLKRQVDPLAQLDLQVLRTATFPILLSLFLYGKAGELISGFLPLFIALLLNGFVLYLPRLLNSGNKDGRSVSRLDAILIGLSGALGAVPGLSRVGAMLSMSSICGLSRSYALDLSLLLSVPALIGLIVLDIIAIVVAPAAVGFVAALMYFLYALIAFGAAWFSIKFQRYLSFKLGFSGFAYYSWGLALFSFIFYLMI